MSSEHVIDFINSYNRAVLEYSEKFIKPMQKKHDERIKHSNSVEIDRIKHGLIDKEQKQDYFNVIP